MQRKLEKDVQTQQLVQNILSLPLHFYFSCTSFFFTGSVHYLPSAFCQVFLLYPKYTLMMGMLKLQFFHHELSNHPKIYFHASGQILLTELCVVLQGTHRVPSHNLHLQVYESGHSE